MFATRPFSESHEKPLFSTQAESSAVESSVELPTRLNNVPHQREVRSFFYRDTTDAILSAVKAGETRISVRQVSKSKQVKGKN